MPIQSCGQNARARHGKRYTEIGLLDVYLVHCECPTASPSASIRDWSAACSPAIMGLHSSTFQLNMCALYGIGGARRGCVARVQGVLGGV
jgi:hypothetical protein